MIVNNKLIFYFVIRSNKAWRLAWLAPSVNTEYFLKLTWQSVSKNSGLRIKRVTFGDLSFWYACSSHDTCCILTVCRAYCFCTIGQVSSLFCSFTKNWHWQYGHSRIDILNSIVQRWVLSPAPCTVCSSHYSNFPLFKLHRMWHLCLGVQAGSANWEDTLN